MSAAVDPRYASGTVSGSNDATGAGGVVRQPAKAARCATTAMSTRVRPTRARMRSSSQRSPAPVYGPRGARRAAVAVVGRHVRPLSSPGSRPSRAEAAVFVEEYLRDLRRDRFAPAALVLYARRCGARVREEIYANPGAVRSVWNVALGFFAAT